MLEFNWKNADSAIIGKDGIDVQQEFNNYKDKIEQIVEDIYTNKNTDGRWLRWLTLGYDDEVVKQISEYASKVKGKFENILVLGIGGSALGCIAVTEAVLKPYWNLLTVPARNNYPRIFVFDNVDPDQISGLLSTLDLKKTLVNIITKSGNTAETMSQFMIVREKLEKLLGADYKNNIVATTDKAKGILREIVDKEGFESFIVPDDVGGRFSVFSAVGLLPFALVGVNIAELLRGIRDIDQQLQNTDINENIAAQGALIQYLMNKKLKIFL